MLKLYTCYCCGFPFKSDDQELPTECPASGANPDNFLVEPYNEQEIRRIHVDPPLPDPNRDPYNLEWHMPKDFPPRSRNGRLRRFVLEYDKPEQLKTFYQDLFGWDIINTEEAEEESPLMYCATGPGSSNWEPRVVSFCYGFLKDKKTDTTGKYPHYVIEVSSIEDTCKLVVENGGKVLKDTYEVDGMKYAIIEDTEGNALYLWQTPNTVTWMEPESKNKGPVK